MINHVLKQAIKRLSAACALAFIAVALCMPIRFAFADNGCSSSKDPGCDYLPLTTIPGAFTANTPTNPISVITNIYGVSIGVAAILAVGMITWAGIQYATTEAVTGKSDAKGHWEGAIWGLVILLGSYIMLRTINVDLVNINLDLGKPNGGVTVSKDALNDVLAAAKQASDSAIAQAQVARNELDGVQKILDGTQVQRDTYAAQLADLDPEDASKAAERADLISKIAAADKQISDAKATIAQKQVAVATSVVDASVKKTTTDVVSALSAGEIDTAKSIQKSGSEAADQSIAKLEQTPNTPATAVAQAKIAKIVGDNDTNQKILIAEQLNAIKNSNSSALNKNTSAKAELVADYDISRDPGTQQLIINARQAIADQYNKSQVSIRAIDPTQVDAVKTTSAANQTSFDAAVAKIVGCPNGIFVQSQSVSCKP